MKKIAIIAPSSLSYVPYLCYYENILADMGIPYDIYYWDRFSTGERPENCKIFTSNSPINGVWSLKGYLGFKTFLLRHLLKERYCLYVVLSVQVGILLYKYLSNKPYILDIRDFSHQDNIIYRHFSNRLTEKASAAVISSEGFRSWLPKKQNYILSHNCSIGQTQKRTRPRFDAKCLVISYIGMVAYYEANICVINAVAPNKNILLRYIGSGTCEKNLEDFCKKYHFDNVEFFGSYDSSIKLSFYQHTDFVLSCYGSNNEVVRSSIPNRLYESCIAGRPIIVNSGTYLAHLVESNGLGIVVDLNNLETLCSDMVKYCDENHYNRYVRNCDRFLEKVRIDILNFDSQVGEVINSTIRSS